MARCPCGFRIYCLTTALFVICTAAPLVAKKLAACFCISTVVCGEADGSSSEECTPLTNCTELWMPVADCVVELIRARPSAEMIGKPPDSGALGTVFGITWSGSQLPLAS